MQYLLLMACIMASAGCSYFDKHEKKASDPLNADQLSRLHAVSDVYAADGNEAEDAAGFVHSTCDGLLFTALYDALSGSANVLKAQAEPGHWYRHPDHATCSNDISRDMLIGLAWWAWETGAGKVAQDVVDYAKAHNMKMGEGPVDVVTMSPELLDTFYQVSKYFGGANDPELDKAAEQIRQEQEANHLTSLPLPGGFLGHLLVLHELLRAHIYGGSSTYQLAVFKQKASEQPNNALFQAAYHLYDGGDQSEAYRILDDTRYFPADKLPTAGERCEEYLWQRDEETRAGGDWAPCDVPAGTKPWSGTDLRFALKVAENKMRHK